VTAITPTFNKKMVVTEKKLQAQDQQYQRHYFHATKMVTLNRIAYSYKIQNCTDGLVRQNYDIIWIPQI